MAKFVLAMINMSIENVIMHTNGHQVTFSCAGDHKISRVCACVSDLVTCN